jgi:hypothetical protein
VIAALALLTGRLPRPVSGAGGEGSAARRPCPVAAAMALNNEGKALYRQGRWAEARTKYQARWTPIPSGWPRRSTPPARWPARSGSPPPPPRGRR